MATGEEVGEQDHLSETGEAGVTTGREGVTGMGGEDGISRQHTYID